MSRERMVSYHLSRLQDRRATVNTRLDAIRELVLLQAVEALPTLQAVNENDPDEEVQKAAREAGRTLFLKHRANKNE